MVEDIIQPVGFSPIGFPRRSERHLTSEGGSLTEVPMIVEIAEKHEAHPAIVWNKETVQRGQTAIAFAVNPRNFIPNLPVVIIQTSLERGIEQIASVDWNCRLIKD